MERRKEYQLKIGDHVRKWRMLRNMKQKELARQMQLSAAAISNIENDHTTPNLHQVEDLADCFGITVEMLFEGPEIVINRLRPGNGNYK